MLQTLQAPAFFSSGTRSVNQWGGAALVTPPPPGSPAHNPEPLPQSGASRLRPAAHLRRRSGQSVGLPRASLTESEDRAGEAADARAWLGPADGGGQRETPPAQPRHTHPRRASSPRRFTPHALNTSSCVRAPSRTAPKRNATSGPPPGGLTCRGDGLEPGRRAAPGSPDRKGRFQGGMKGVEKRKRSKGQ